MLPFYFTDKANELDLTYDEKNEFIDIRFSSITQLLFNSKKKGHRFWLSLASQYSTIIVFIKYLFKWFTPNRGTM